MSTIKTCRETLLAAFTVNSDNYKKLVSKSYNNYSATSSLMDTEIPAVAVVPGQKRSRKGGDARNKKVVNGGGSGESEHEIHIWTERERRKKMRNMFSSLHALLPQLPAKADKSSIVDEAVKYIKTLQQTLQTLQKQKVEKFQGAIIDYEPSVITSLTDTVGSREASFAALGPSKNFPLTSKMSQNSFSVSLSPACFQTWFSPNVVMNMCGNDAQFSLCSTRKPGLLATILYILEKHNLDVVSAHISSDQYRSIYTIHAHADGASDQYPEAMSVEDTFKLAAGEMNLWVMSC
ncbi:transcription factor bHLH95 isoform X2 [Populus nigra]|uniref:transcription factor bHLH95 isoform X2 n=1 Tax=Populus nigra TaxID=3691 RepID=UPI002B2726F0|nr:transcription factor bHLH95 isoform X2 [Populus nigra]